MPLHADHGGALSKHDSQDPLDDLPTPTADSKGEDLPLLAAAHNARSDSFQGLSHAGSLASSDQTPPVLWLALPKRECARLIYLGMPLSLQAVLSFSATLISMAFVGHIGKHELSAAVLGTSLFNVTGLSIVIGLCSAMETLCGQSFGAKQYSNLGIYLQRALLVSAAACVLIVVLWMQLDALLILLGQDAAIAALASRYIRLLIPALAFLSTSECLRRYLMTQGIINPATAIAASATSISVPYNLIAIQWLGLGLDGAALAVNCTQLTNMLGLLAYIAHREKQLTGTDQQTWHGWNSQCLKGWFPYLKIAIPSLAMICMEWWCFEAIILLAGRLAQPEVAIDVVGICVNLATWTFMFPYGLSGAASVRVSNELGAGQAVAARLAAQCAMGVALSLMTAIAAILICLHRILPLILTSDPLVVLGTQQVLPIVAITLIGDGLNGVLAGVIRGCGRQATGAAINLVTYWCFGLPLATLLAFHFNMGVPGLWTGLMCTSVLQGCVMSFITLKFDYTHEVKRAAAATTAHTISKVMDVEADIQLTAPAVASQPVVGGAAL